MGGARRIPGRAAGEPPARSLVDIVHRRLAPSARVAAEPGPVRRSRRTSAGRRRLLLGRHDQVEQHTPPVPRSASARRSRRHDPAGRQPLAQIGGLTVKSRSCFGGGGGSGGMGTGGDGRGDCRSDPGGSCPSSGLSIASSRCWSARSHRSRSRASRCSRSCRSRATGDEATGSRYTRRRPSPRGSGAATSAPALAGAGGAGRRA